MCKKVILKPMKNFSTVKKQDLKNSKLIGMGRREKTDILNLEVGEISKWEQAKLLGNLLWIKGKIEANSYITKNQKQIKWIGGIGSGLIGLLIIYSIYSLNFIPNREKNNMENNYKVVETLLEQNFPENNKTI